MPIADPGRMANRARFGSGQLPGFAILSLRPPTHDGSCSMQPTPGPGEFKGEDAQSERYDHDRGSREHQQRDPHQEQRAADRQNHDLTRQNDGIGTRATVAIVEHAARLERMTPVRLRPWIGCFVFH
jgi:hypothetical protein